MRVGVVRPDGWFTVVRPADGRVIGYATVSIPATTASRVAAPEPSAADAGNMVERFGPFALIAAGLAVGAWVAHVAVRRCPLSEHPPQPCTEILCVQAKCYKGWVRTATVDRLRGVVERYRLKEAAPHAHVRGVLVTARDQVDEIARDELTRHDLHHECIPPLTAVWSILDDQERGKEYERFVGDEYRRRGYLVEPRGLERGIDDDGLDLICVRSSRPAAPFSLS